MRTTFMTTRQRISRRLRQTAPVPSDNEAFVRDTIRQINLLPEPHSREQALIRSVSLRERWAFRLGITRMVVVSGGGCLLLSYLFITYLDTLMTLLTTLAQQLLSWL